MKVVSCQDTEIFCHLMLTLRKMCGLRSLTDYCLHAYTSEQVNECDFGTGGFTPALVAPAVAMW